MNTDKIANLLKYLCSPEDKSDLILDLQEKNLKNSAGEEFELIDNIPILLKNNSKNDTPKSELHLATKTEFNYVEHYQKDAEVFDYFSHKGGATQDEEKRVNEYIEAHVSKTAKILLDVGCGSAWVAKKFCTKGINVISMDISVTNVKKALEIYPFSNHYGVVADAFNLPFKANSIDCIIASEIIEHVANPQLFIANLFNILKPEGKLIVTTPYKEKLKYSLCVHCNQLTPLSSHIHSFDENKLISLFQNPQISKIEYQRFANKFIAYFRLYKIFRFLGFNTWRMLDKIFNFFYNKQNRILISWYKK